MFAQFLVSHETYFLQLPYRRFNIRIRLRDGVIEEACLLSDCLTDRMYTFRAALLCAPVKVVVWQE